MLLFTDRLLYIITTLRYGRHFSCRGGGGVRPRLKVCERNERNKKNGNKIVGVALGKGDARVLRDQDLCVNLCTYVCICTYKHIYFLFFCFL